MRNPGTQTTLGTRRSEEKKRDITINRMSTQVLKKGNQFLFLYDTHRVTPVYALSVIEERTNLHIREKMI